jgi:hypothetical protein
MPKPELVSVGVTYPGADKPYKHEYAQGSPMSQVKQDVISFFGLAETVDAAGNQTVYNFRKGNDPIDLSLTVGDISGEHPHLQLRLIREVIAGWTTSRPHST